MSIRPRCRSCATAVQRTSRSPCLMAARSPFSTSSTGSTRYRFSSSRTPITQWTFGPREEGDPVRGRAQPQRLRHAGRRHARPGPRRRRYYLSGGGSERHLHLRRVTGTTPFTSAIPTTTGVDTLLFNPDVDPSSVRFARSANLVDLIVTLADGSALTISTGSTTLQPDTDFPVPGRQPRNCPPASSLP